MVHCSAGVGRSGCYVALHALIQQIDRSGMVDVFGFLLNARKQRMGLCQNESQCELLDHSYIQLHNKYNSVARASVCTTLTDWSCLEVRLSAHRLWMCSIKHVFPFNLLDKY